MTVRNLTEGDLQLTINGAIAARKFDDDSSHELSHCMKAVDFIVEYPDFYPFIELKDPQNPNASPPSQKDFIQRFKSGQLDEDLKLKFRDSFLYEWAAGRADDKPVHFLVLIALASLRQADLDRRTGALQKKLPLHGPPSGSWIRPPVRSCTVFNITAWNKRFSDLTVTRLSAENAKPGTT